MSAEQGPDLGQVILKLDEASRAIRSREWWSNAEARECMGLVLDREKRDIWENRSLFDLLQSHRPDTSGTYSAVYAYAETVERLALDVEESGEVIESRIWEVLEELINAHRSVIEELYFERSTSHPNFRMSQEQAAQVLEAKSGRDEALSIFRQFWRMTTAARQADELSRSALAAAEEADTARRQAQRLAAGTGDEALSKHFTSLAAIERTSAQRWTWSSILTTALGIAAGVVVHTAFDFGSDVADALYPLLIAVGAAGLATYFARLGGHHRHTAQWAKSVAVQLDSYARFVEHTDDEGAQKVFERFAGRVLGAPPPRSERAATQSATIADIAAIAARNA